MIIFIVTIINLSLSSLSTFISNTNNYKSQRVAMTTQAEEGGGGGDEKGSQKKLKNTYSIDHCYLVVV